jgi:hypothetical protein
VRGGNIVSDTVYPGSQRALLIEFGEAAPEMKVNFLEQVTAGLSVQLISPGQTVEGGAVGFGCLLIQGILARVFLPHGFELLHI